MVIQGITGTRCQNLIIASTVAHMLQFKQNIVGSVIAAFRISIIIVCGLITVWEVRIIRCLLV
jgi:hypothetical protein